MRKKLTTVPVLNKPVLQKITTANLQTSEIAAIQLNPAQHH
jgi:hypothetical protein